MISALFASLLAVQTVASPVAVSSPSVIAPLFKPSLSAWPWDPKIGYTTGAPVITNPVNVYYIYYGDFTDAQKSILEGFIQGLDQSAWWSMTKSYYYQASSSSEKVFVNGKVTLAKTVHDNYSKGKSLNGNALPDIIQAQVDAGSLPEDSDAVYFVLTASDVKEKMRDDMGGASFCSEYCGYHMSWPLKSGKRVYYAMAGNAHACLHGCAPGTNNNKSPNGDVEIDAMVSVIAHELTEAVTDPESDGTRAWQFSSGYENADQCAYKYGSTKTTANGASYNLEFGGKTYMVQQNWNVVTQKCSMS